MPVPIAVAPRLTSRNRAVGLLQARDVFLDGGEVGVELLPERHRDRVLKLRPPDLEHVAELDRLRLEGESEFIERSDQRRCREDDRQPQRGRIGVIGGLRHVDVVIGVKRRVVSLRTPHQLERDIGDHLVGVHVGGGSGAALDRIDHELVVIAPVLRDQIAGAVNRVGLRRRQVSKTPVGARRSLLHQHQRPHEFRKMADRNAGDGEIVDRTQGVNSPIGIPRNVGVADQIVFTACRHARQFDRPRRRDGNRFRGSHVDLGFNHCRCFLPKGCSASSGR